MGLTKKHLPGRLGSGAVALGAALGLVLVGPAAQAASTYYQGFEQDTSGWTDADSGWSGSVERVMSGTGAVTSSEGSWHAVMNDDVTTGPFSRFDGYRDEWPGDYTAEIDVYLDPAWATGSGFDYSVAANGSDGGHQRDFIFHAYKGEEAGLIVGASNNTRVVGGTKTVREDLASFSNTYEVTEAGWYTLQHHFYDAGGVLAVDLNLLDSDGELVFTETRSSDLDQMSEIGGNRYAWFTVIDVDGGINVDAHELILPGDYPTGEITSPGEGDDVSGTLNLAATYDDGDDSNDDAVQWAVREGTCAAGTDTVAGNVDGFNDASSWDGTDFTATLDVSEYESGEYCFVFNPTDDPGEANVRESVEFTVTKVAPTASNECKNGGWQEFATEYKNQGQCIADAQSNENSKHHRG